jgi:hypothetical protein
LAILYTVAIFPGKGITIYTLLYANLHSHLYTHTCCCFSRGNYFCTSNQTKVIPRDDDQNLFLLLQNQIQELNRLIEQKTSDTNKVMAETQNSLHKTIQSQFGQSMKIITDVTQQLTKLDETNRQVISFTDQLQSLQDILKNPKQRGILGEYYLETLLKNVLAPNQYQMQYSFSNGEIVDAAVFIKDKIIPVDSKFSLENYNRMVEVTDTTEKLRLEKLFINDLKSRISETAKYIRPEEGTMDFAFMFIPHEAIYYDLLINKIGAISEDYGKSYSTSSWQIQGNYCFANFFFGIFTNCFTGSQSHANRRNYQRYN